MTFATKVLPGPMLSPLEDGPELPPLGPEHTVSRDQMAGKEDSEGTRLPRTKKARR